MVVGSGKTVVVVGGKGTRHDVSVLVEAECGIGVEAEVIAHFQPLKEGRFLLEGDGTLRRVVGELGEERTFNLTHSQSVANSANHTADLAENITLDTVNGLF